MTYSSLVLLPLENLTQLVGNIVAFHGLHCTFHYHLDVLLQLSQSVDDLRQSTNCLEKYVLAAGESGRSAWAPEGTWATSSALSESMAAT